MGDWLDYGGARSAISAPRADDLRAAGLLQADLTLTGDPADPGRPVLGRASVDDLSGTWVVRGDAGVVSAGRANGWSASFAGRLAAFELLAPDVTHGPPFQTRIDLAAREVGRFFARPYVREVRVLAGADLGADGRFGGAGADADTFGPGAIGRLDLRSSVYRSVFAAGLDPVNGTPLDGDDRVVGGPASRLGSASFRVPPAPDVRVVAGALPATVRVGGRPAAVDPADPVFGLTPVD